MFIKENVENAFYLDKFGDFSSKVSFKERKYVK